MSDRNTTPLPNRFSDPWPDIPWWNGYRESQLAAAFEQKGFWEAALLVSSVICVNQEHIRIYTLERKLTEIRRYEDVIPEMQEALEANTTHPHAQEIRDKIRLCEAELITARNEFTAETTDFLIKARENNARMYDFFKTPEVQLLPDRIRAAIHIADLKEPLSLIEIFCAFATPAEIRNIFDVLVEKLTALLPNEPPPPPPEPAAGVVVSYAPDENNLKTQLYHLREISRQLRPDRSATYLVPVSHPKNQFMFSGIPKRHLTGQHFIFLAKLMTRRAEDRYWAQYHKRLAADLSMWASKHPDSKLSVMARASEEIWLHIASFVVVHTAWPC
jgi:hypothetical protein